MTLLAIPLFRSYGLEQKIAGNTREKQRAFEAAESALQYGEWWLTYGDPGTGSACDKPATISAREDMRTCSNPLVTSGDPRDWAGTSSYTPPQMTVVPGGGGGLNTAGTDIKYARVPGLYVAYLGLSASGAETLYSVTGVGYGGSADSAAVVQSVYQTSYSIKDLTGP